MDTKFLIDKVLSIKKSEEDKREKLNQFYILACSIIFSIIPFINTLGEKVNEEWFSTIAFLPIMGLVITFSWILSLISIYRNIISINRTLYSIDQGFYEKVERVLDHPPRAFYGFVTLAESVVPLTFLTSFIILIFQELIID